MIKFFTSTEKSDNLVTLFGISFIAFGWIALSLTLSNTFFPSMIAVGASFAFSIILFVGSRLLLQASTDLRIVFLMSFAIACVIFSLTVPTLFSGRDQGSISEASFRLAQNNQLTFSTDASKAFFTLYGEGTALNFPGFAYTKTGELVTQFPLAYTSWLASFVSLFGLSGFALANSILLFLSLLVLYALLRIFVHPFYAFSGFILMISSFLPLWFAKITLSENLALFLFLFLVWSLILFLREGKFISYVGVLLSGGLFAFTRIEGFAFLFLAFTILLFNKHTRHIWKTYPWKSIIVPGFFFLMIFLRDFFVNIPYYKMIGKALVKFLRQLTEGSVVGDLSATGSTITLESVFFLYGLLVLFLTGFFGILFLIRKKYFIALIPTLIALPTFIYLIDPNISLDHPWMLRRYLFSLFPTFLFSAVVGIALLFAKEKRFPLEKPRGKRLFFVSIIFAGLLALQYPASSYGFFFAENRGLREQAIAFSEKFSDTDLVLIDRGVTGDGFAMITGPAQYLTKKNMVYFFNPHDLAPLDTTAFSRVFLLTPDAVLPFYTNVLGARMIFRESIIFSTEKLEHNSLENNGFFFRLPQKNIAETHNSLFQIY